MDPHKWWLEKLCSSSGPPALDEKLNFLIQDNYRADHVPCIFPENTPSFLKLDSAQFPIHFPTHLLKFSRTGAQKVKESVQEIAPCPKLQEIWIFFPVQGRHQEVINFTTITNHTMSIAIHTGSIPVNRPYLGGTVPLLLRLPLSHRPTFTLFCPTFLNPLQSR